MERASFSLLSLLASSIAPLLRIGKVGGWRRRGKSLEIFILMKILRHLIIPRAGKRKSRIHWENMANILISFAGSHKCGASSTFRTFSRYVCLSNPVSELRKSHTHVLGEGGEDACKEPARPTPERECITKSYSPQE